MSVFEFYVVEGCVYYVNNCSFLLYFVNYKIIKNKRSKANIHTFDVKQLYCSKNGLLLGFRNCDFTYHVISDVIIKYLTDKVR